MGLKYLEEQIEQHARSLEAMGPIMTSLVQLIDSHQSITQAEDVRRLNVHRNRLYPFDFYERDIQNE